MAAVSKLLQAVNKKVCKNLTKALKYGKTKINRLANCMNHLHTAGMIHEKQERIIKC